uniref:B30.2/SPRY domain-containing protein n=1 Tax=Apteryx owenii TaxID=8824 RepID=A0A8B9P5P3_APTOW
VHAGSSLSVSSSKLGDMGSMKVQKLEVAWGRRLPTAHHKRGGGMTSEGVYGDTDRKSTKRFHVYYYLWHDLIVAVDVTLDADTAHSRLEVSPDGKRVSDTGTIRNVPKTEKRFDSHTFLLAKEGYTSGKHYWEVDVGKKRNWDVGIAQEPVTCKGTLTLSPEKGFWVIRLADGRDYWARTVPWTRLAVSGKPRKTGIFLDASAKKLSFFNVNNETHSHTFTLGGDSSQGGKFFPFFSTGSPSAKPDTEPLKIVLGFEEDHDDE